jgi:hypothetical protein
VYAANLVVPGIVDRPRTIAVDDVAAERREAGMRERIYRARVGAENAARLANESRTHWLASEYRPRDVGGGWIELSERGLGASRELGEEEDGAITDDADGLRIWVGDNAYDLDADG